jgi:hypothetical protein
LALAKQLIAYVWQVQCQETKEIIRFNFEKLRFSEPESVNYAEDHLVESVYQTLFNTPLNLVRIHWTLIQEFNFALSECLPMIDMKKYQLSEESLSLSCALSQLRELWITPIKLDFIQHVL